MAPTCHFQLHQHLPGHTLERDLAAVGSLVGAPDVPQEQGHVPVSEFRVEKFRPAPISFIRLLPPTLPVVAAHGDPLGLAVERPPDGEIPGNGHGSHLAGQDHPVPDDSEDGSFGSAEESTCFRRKRGLVLVFCFVFSMKFHWNRFHPQQERNQEENKMIGMCLGFILWRFEQ